MSCGAREKILQTFGIFSCLLVHIPSIFIPSVSWTYWLLDIETNVEFLQGMTKMVLELASRRVADALFMEDLGVDISSLMSATKLIILELEEVSEHCACTSLQHNIQICSRLVELLQCTMKSNVCISAHQARENMHNMKQEVHKLDNDIKTLSDYLDNSLDCILKAATGNLDQAKN